MEPAWPGRIGSNVIRVVAAPCPVESRPAALLNSASALAPERPLARSRAVRLADLRRIGVRSKVGGVRLHAALARQGLSKLALQVVLAVIVGRDSRSPGVSRLRTFWR